MPKKHKGQKAFFRDFTHEMFRKTEIDRCMERVQRHNIEEKKAFLNSYRGMTHTDICNDRTFFDTVETALRNTVDSVNFYECLDAWIFAALSLSNTRDVDPKTSSIELALHKLTEWLVQHQFNYPGFISPEGKFDEAVFKPFMNGHLYLTRLLNLWSLDGKFVYKLSSELAEMLKLTKLDTFPTEYLRLPQKTIYISPPKGTWPNISTFDSEEEFDKHLGAYGIKDDLSFANADGVLISEYEKEEELENYREWDIITFQRVQAATGNTISLNKVWTLKFSGKPEETVRDIISKARTGFTGNPAESRLRVTNKVLEYLIATVIYITVQDSDKIFAEESPQYAAWVKELQQSKLSRKQEKLLRQQIETAKNARHCYLGGSIKIDRHAGVEPLPEERVKGTHASPRTHWRSGHFRGVWKGSKEVKYSENVWIKPVIVNLGKDTVAAKQRIVS